MAIVGKLTKLKSLKSAMKRWPSLSKQARGPSSPAAVAAAADGDAQITASAANLHAVYVGKSRRRYLVTSDVAAHPLFRELVVEEMEEHDGGAGGFVVACEVVLFEHLLWMLENNAADGAELVEFYTC